MRANRYVPLIGGFALLFGLGLALGDPQRWIIALVCGVMVASSTCVALVWGSAPPRWPVFATSVLCVLTGWSLLIYLSGDLTRQLLVLAVVGLLTLYWESTRRVRYDVATVHPEEIENVTLLVHLVTVWFASSFFYRLLLDTSVLPSVLSAHVYTLAVTAMLSLVVVLDGWAVWLSRYEPYRRFSLVTVLALLTTELFWTMNFLPLAPDVKAFVVGFTYYIVADIGRAHFDKMLNAKVLRHYLYFGIPLFAVVLATAKWLV